MVKDIRTGPEGSFFFPRAFLKRLLCFQTKQSALLPSTVPRRRWQFTVAPTSRRKGIWMKYETRGASLWSANYARKGNIDVSGVEEEDEEVQMMSAIFVLLSFLFSLPLRTP